MIFTVVSLFVISASTKKNDENTVTAEAGGHLLEKEDDLENRPDDAHKKDGQTVEDTHTFEISSATITFQFLLILASMYYAVLCTNWGDLQLYSGDATNDKNAPVATGDGSDTSFWLKIVAEWITMSLYIFSLLAPICFPGRDF